MSLELIFRLVVFCKTGPWHLPHSFVSFSFTKQFSQWSFRIQACLKTISHNHSHQPTHTAAHTPHSHTSNTCRYPFNLLHTLSPQECLAVGFVYSWVWIILVSEEERGGLVGGLPLKSGWQPCQKFCRYTQTQPKHALGGIDLTLLM